MGYDLDPVECIAQRTRFISGDSGELAGSVYTRHERPMARIGLNERGRRWCFNIVFPPGVPPLPGDKPMDAGISGVIIPSRQVSYDSAGWNPKTRKLRRY